MEFYVRCDISNLIEWAGERATSLRRRLSVLVGFSKECAGATALLVLGVQLAAAQMAVPGKFAVSNSGAATYSIPIVIPPGTAGMSPSLSLKYSSQAGVGIVGVGWSMEGLPSVGRCPRTKAQDGVFGSINNDANDRFCLDGQRLIAINGPYGGDGTEYRTEIESFSRIISHGVTSGAPAWFEVWTKSGRIMEFGNTADSRISAQGTGVPRAWALNKVADTKGNYFAVSYVNDGLQAYPTRIDYTGNTAAGLAAYNSVRFIYEARPDTVPTYRAGSKMQTSVRLIRIRGYAGEDMVTNYILSYEQSPSTQRSRLASVSKCDDGGTCLPATTFGWQDATQAFDPPNVWLASFGNIAATGGFDSNVKYPRFVVDVNGDGKPDVVGFGGDAVHVSLNTGGSFAAPQVWLSCSFTISCAWPTDGIAPPCAAGSANLVLCGGSPNNGSYPRYVVDVNGDGLPDILGFGADAIQVSINGGAFFYSPQVWLSCSFTVNCPSSGFSDDNLYPRYLADVNGDGLPDIVGFSDNDVLVSLNGGGFFYGPASWLSCSYTRVCGSWPNNTSYPRFLVDVNHDGLPDIVGFGGSDVYVSLNTGSSFSSPQAWLHCSFTVTCGGWPSNPDVYPRHLVDMNNDGLPDIVGISGGAVHVALNTGKSFASPQAWISCSYTFDCGGWPNDSSYPRRFVDVNGDGLVDLVGFSGNYVFASINEGASFNGAPAWLYCSFTVACGGWTNVYAFPRQLVDVNGDGLPDIVGFGSGGTYVSLNGGPNGAPDLITSITTGLGVTTTVTYKTLTAPGVYTKDNSGGVPIVDIIGPLNVVSQVATSNGVGGVLQSDYSYAGGKADIRGRGFLGFRQVKAVGVQTGIAQTTNYLQSFPYIGLVSSVTKQAATQTLDQATNTYQFSNASNGATVSAPSVSSAPYRVSLARRVETRSDLDGSAMPSTTSTFQYDAYGNATQVAVSNSDGHSKTTTNTYTNDTTNWFLGRLMTSSVTAQAP